MMDLGELAAHLLTAGDDIEAAQEEACLRARKLVARKARGQLGVPQPFWLPLKPRNNRPETSWHVRRIGVELIPPHEEDGWRVDGQVRSYRKPGAPSSG